MGVALVIVIIPVLVLTAIVLLTVLSDLHVGVILAAGVFLGILYFAVVGLLKAEHEEDLDAPAPGEDKAPLAEERAADVEAGRDEIQSVEDPEDPATEHRSPGA